MLLKQKSPSLPRNLAIETSGELLIVFSTKVNLVYLLYSTTQRYPIIFSNFNLMIKCPPPYEELVWENKKANIDSIQKVLQQFNWRFLFSKKSVHQQVKILNNSFMNVCFSTLFLTNQLLLIIKTHFGCLSI